MRFRSDSPRIRTSGRTRLTAVIVACALFMQNLDSTVIATALPTMAKAFGADPVHMNVALTSYLLSLAVFIPASGWVADRYGTRTVFRAAIAVFTIGSVLCGRADSLAFLVAARVLQGIGGAMMVPVGRLVSAAHSAEERACRGDGVAHHAGAARPGAWAAGRWFHCHLFLLALDLRHQRAHRHHRHHPGQHVRGGCPRAATRPVRCHWTVALWDRALWSDVRPGDGGPRRRAARPHRGDGRCRPCRHPRVSGSRVAASCAAARSFADAIALLRRRFVRDDAVSHRHRGHSVSVAVDAASGLWRFGCAERLDYVCQFGGRTGDEAGHAIRAARVRVPRHAGVEWRGVGGDDRDLRCVPADMAGGGNLCRPTDRGFLSVVAIYCLQHAGLWRRAALADEFGDKPLCHRPAACRHDRDFRRARCHWRFPGR